MYSVTKQIFLTVPWQIFFCHCRHLKVLQILLVQSQIVGLKNQIRSPSNRCYYSLLLKMPQFLYLFPRIAAPMILYLTMQRFQINCQFFLEFCRLTLWGVLCLLSEKILVEISFFLLFLGTNKGSFVLVMVKPSCSFWHCFL